MSSKVLYITYDGLLEPLGQSQVLRYLEQLSSSYKVYILSFEKSYDWKNDKERNYLQEHINSKQIYWIPLKYHKSPTALATSFDIFQGFLTAFLLVIFKRIKIIHARSYVPSTIALVLKKILGIKFIFDMRGFWADERVDGSLWSKDSYLYLVAKWFEKQFLINADSIISLTKVAIHEIRSYSFADKIKSEFYCIPTCVDLTTFHVSKNNAPCAEMITLGYIGSVSSWYLFEEVLVFFDAFKKQLSQTNFIILTRSDHDLVKNYIKKLDLEYLPIKILEVPHSQVPKIIRQMNIGIFFRKPAYSNLACSPTRLGEFLACGIPCIVNDGVGDMTEIIRTEKVGVVLRCFDDLSILKAIDGILDLLNDKELSKRCRYTAEKYFSLKEGVEKYKKIYSQLENKA
ncbi:glycosyltransferase [Thermosynechococcaceae cyanobacterium Okahandja]